MGLNTAVAFTGQECGAVQLGTFHSSNTQTLGKKKEVYALEVMQSNAVANIQICDWHPYKLCLCAHFPFATSCR